MDSYIQHVALYCLLSFNQSAVDRQIADPDYKDFAYKALSSVIMGGRTCVDRLVSEVLLIGDGRAADSFARYLSDLLQRDEPFDGIEFEEFQEHKQPIVTLACHPSILQHIWKYSGHEHCVRALVHLFWNTNTQNFISEWYSCHAMTR